MKIKVTNPRSTRTIFEGELVDFLTEYKTSLTLHDADDMVKHLYMVGRYVGQGDALLPWFDVEAIPHARSRKVSLLDRVR